MQPNASTETDRTAEIVPAVRPAAPWRVASVAVLPKFRLHVQFVDGTEGEVDMDSFLRDPNINGTVFESLRDPLNFSNAALALGAVQWPTGADLAPDAMYDAIRAYGRWVVE